VREQLIPGGIVGVFIAFLCSCFASTQSSAAAEETVLDCSFRSPTTCWTVSGRFPAVRSKPTAAPLDRAPRQPSAVLASGADRAAPPNLTGRWYAWFRLERGSRLPLATRAHEVTGEVRFSSAPSAPTPQDAATWRRVHAGTAAIEFKPFGFVLGSAEVLGWYQGRDTVRIIFDPTVDHGNVELVGSAEADAVVGRWRLNSDLARAEGEFRLRRLARE
jgi:hypothetical protein